ncbi:uncharacterized protein Pyn_25060 [Prunus yedoensis var. nudiflora]|uniref:DCD domain-containing protein n=1 Tax=Prunus yedoensis var. nudiflora TaxID=2094558 RepID=A0A314Z655_PRUYE|nr:uncharacterized protein Pyn_25060 [Prunus yedoensis var. nudiflora]
MGAGRKTETFTAPPYQGLATYTTSMRNLIKKHLGGVIFGCKDITINECLSKQLFGLPAAHFLYVQNIFPGLPLFLFNYTDRKLHGIYEAAGYGQMNINPCGWTTDGSNTHFLHRLSSVLGCTAGHCLKESKLASVEVAPRTSAPQISQLASVEVAPRTSEPQKTLNWRSCFVALPSHDKIEEPEWLEELTSEAEDFRDVEDSVAGSSHSSFDQRSRESPCSLSAQKSGEIPLSLFEHQALIAKLIEEVGELKAFKTEQSQKISYLEYKLEHAETEIQRLKVWFED